MFFVPAHTPVTRKFLLQLERKSRTMRNKILFTIHRMGIISPSSLELVPKMRWATALPNVISLQRVCIVHMKRHGSVLELKRSVAAGLDHVWINHNDHTHIFHASSTCLEAGIRLQYTGVEDNWWRIPFGTFAEVGFGYMGVVGRDRTKERQRLSNLKAGASAAIVFS